MLGVVVFGGLILIPRLYPIIFRYSRLSSISREDLYGGSMMGCAVFVGSFNRNLRYSLPRFIVAMLFAGFFLPKFVSILGEQQHGNLDSDGTFFIAGGVAGFVLLSLSGLAGILVGRIFKIHKFFEV
jgi:hypothetical protein